MKKPHRRTGQRSKEIKAADRERRVADGPASAVARHEHARAPVFENAAFERFYKAQRLVPEREWDAFLAAARTPLPVCFRVAAGPSQARLEGMLRVDAWGLDGQTVADPTADAAAPPFRVEAPTPVEWLPAGYAWSTNAPKAIVRRCPALKSFQQWLQVESAQGSISRQEAVSMIPPLLLGVRPGQRVLDLCAAPGSKTAQLISLVDGTPAAQPVDHGLVVANDADTSRCYMLVHQLRRFACDSVVVTNHKAQDFPAPDFFLFDRVLCDVPCSGDGTIRKSPQLWRRWNTGLGLGLHELQLAILCRGIELLAVGGIVCYSTCSLNPHENEAVVAEALRRCGSALRLVPSGHMLPGLRFTPGLCTWEVFGQTSRRRDCHFDDTPCLSLLKHLIKVQGGAAE